MRPCECGQATTGAYDPAQCLACWKWLNSAWWRAYWSGEPPPPSAAVDLAASCAHLGDPLTGTDREALVLDHRRDWRRCGLGLSVGGSPPGVVCRCRGCGPACPGYAPANDAAPD